MKYAAAYAMTLTVLLVLDLLWLGVVARPMYQQGIGHLMAENANFRAAVVFYLVYVLGLLQFGLVPNVAAPGVARAALSAAIFGFFVYASYDLTNMAVLKDWPLQLALIDMIWGTFVSAVSTVAGKAVFDRLS